MKEMVNRVLALQKGRVVELYFPASTSQVYYFEKEEEAAQFVISCDRLEKFMGSIVPEEAFDASFKQLLSEVITELHVPVVKMEERGFDLL